MKVLHVLNELNPSGAEAMLHAAASFWKGEGVAGEVLSTGSVPGSYASHLQQVDYRIHHIPFTPGWRFVEALHDLLRTNQYNAVHVHSERVSFWAEVTAYVAGVPHIVRTMHSAYPLDGLAKWKRVLQRWISRRLLDVKMVSISPSVQENERRRFANETKCIPNWFDSQRIVPAAAGERELARQALGIPDDDFVMVSIGNCSPIKNHHALIEALTLLPPSLAICYLHVGNEEPECPEQALAKQLNVTGRVRFLGQRLDKHTLLHAADLYVMPSAYEGFGVAAVEAMGAGLPVVLSDVAGLRDFRQTCPDVLWVEPTAKSIARTLLEFSSWAEYRRRETGRLLARAAHKWYGIERGAQAYANLYGGKIE